VHMDPAVMINTHLDLVLGGLQVRPAAAYKAGPKAVAAKRRAA
jgi:hypothetical protein